MDRQVENIMPSASLDWRKHKMQVQDTRASILFIYFCIYITILY